MIRVAYIAEQFHEFSTEILHGADYDPRCDVCTYHTKIVETILQEWIKEAFFVEAGWDQQPYFEIADKKRMVILKRSTDPFIARVAKWFGENFEDTIRLAGIDTIMFREHGTNISYALKIAQVTI